MTAAAKHKAAAAGGLKLREPAVLVGLHSGKVLLTMDENGARDPETLKVSNPGKQQAVPSKFKKGAFAAARHAAGGISVGAGPGGHVYENPMAPSSGSGSGIDPAVKLARQQDIDTNRLYLEERKRANLARTGEEFNLQQAGRNTEDIVNTARAKTLRNAAENDRYSAFGLDQPEEVTVQPGQEGQVQAPGVRAKLRTQQENMADVYGQADRLRSLGLEQASYKTGESGLNVSQALLNAAGKGESGGGAQSSGAARAMDYQSQHPTVARSGNFTNSGADSYDQAQARGAQLAKHNLALSPGLQRNQNLAAAKSMYSTQAVEDPFTGQPTTRSDILSTYGTPAQQALRRANDAVTEDPVTGAPISRADANAKYGGPLGRSIAERQNSVVRDPVTGELKSFRDVQGRTDPKTGNVRQADGTWVDPRNDGRNVWRDGRWEDTLTGNVQIDSRTWQSPQGYLFHVMDPASGRGVWTDANGTLFKSQAAGPFGGTTKGGGLVVNPQTGEAEQE